ncbi:carbohydrate ABC transporter permease [Spirochaeta cellobiosiphila]|uniref:carbohydrate ABC transporter permease n=1 Tax=Spirochaeta cellobiosiphila TaxID=504483 RepID=UPI00041099CB|nr:carbohydrate ABC transporter permease [Spirochaeta cellobiosiphila]
MFTKQSFKQKLIIQILLATLGIIYIIPMANVVISSFGGGGIKNYTYLFTSGFPITRMIFNSFLVSILQIILIISVSSLSAFAFSKISFKGRDLIYLLVILTMSISILCFISPLFRTMKVLGWMNTYKALVFPAATFWMPVAILIQKNYFDSLGREYLEAVMIEGGGYFKAWSYVYLPLSKPAAANVIVFAFINSWNDYLNPLLFSRTDQMKTLPMAVVSLTSSIYGARPEVVFACLVIMAIPSVCVYLLLQDQLGEGMTAGALKG